MFLSSPYRISSVIIHIQERKQETGKREGVRERESKQERVAHKRLTYVRK